MQPSFYLFPEISLPRQPFRLVKKNLHQHLQIQKPPEKTFLDFPASTALHNTDTIVASLLQFQEHEGS